MTPRPEDVALLRRVAQEDRSGCGIACLAMATGRTYAQVRESVIASGAETREFMEHLLASVGNGAGITERKIQWWLHREGYFTCVWWPTPAGSPSRALPTTGCAILLTDSECGGHFVVLADGQYLDPARETPLPSYTVRQVIEVQPPRASRLEGEGRDGERLAEAVLDLWDSRPAVIANDAEYFAHTARQDAKREKVLELARAISPASSPQPTTTTEEGPC